MKGKNTKINNVVNLFKNMYLGLMILLLDLGLRFPDNSREWFRSQKGQEIAYSKIEISVKEIIVIKTHIFWFHKENKISSIRVLVGFLIGL